MTDPRIIILANNLINYSCEVQPGEKVLIESIGLEAPLVKELVKAVYAAGGLPFVTIKERSLDRVLILQASEEQLKMMAHYEAIRMSDMDAYIGIRSGDNAAEFSDIPAEKMELYQKLFLQEVHMKIRVPRTKWVILRYPSPSMAQLANTSTESFEDFYFEVCNLDYARMAKAMNPLVELMNQTDQVHIKGPGTDLRFSIKGIPAIKCAGKQNIPDGEVFTAPVRDSVNGHITYNTPALYQGKAFDQIYLEFKDGKVINARANNSEQLNRILNTDEGARYIGEFAIGVNPYVIKPMRDTLFDEKISGSIHFTPGDSYDECPNGNKSAIHWDLVLIQTPDYGGGEIYFDNQLIRQDGLFVLPELKPLNPENLK
ncbi:aminopeptidase [Syntrophomonas erecta]